MDKKDEINNFEDIEKLERKFNWGAFLLGWIWGLFNKSYVTLVQMPVALIPYWGWWLNLGLAVFFGIRGNKWALSKKQFASSADFTTYQKLLACSGIILQATLIILVKIETEISALHPVGYDFSITNKLIKGLLLVLLVIYIIVGGFIVRLIQQARHKD